MADQITVRIVGDESGLKASANEAAQSVEQLGKKMEETGSGGSERLYQGLAHVSTHIAGEAIPGMSRMTRSIGMMGEAAIGVGPFLAVMIPLAALVAGALAYNKLQEAAEKTAKAQAELAVESSKLNDKILEENEHLTALVQGPMAAAALKAKDWGDRTNEVSSILGKVDTELEAHTSKWAAYVQWVQKGTDNVIAFTTGNLGQVSSLGITDTALKTQLETIDRLYTKNGQYGEALKALNEINRQLAQTGGPHSDEQVAVVSDLAVKLGQAQRAALTQKAALDVEATHAEQKNTADRVENLTGEITRYKNLWDIKVQDASSAQKRLQDLDKGKVATAEVDKSLPGIQAVTDLKLSLNAQEATQAQGINDLKIAAANSEANKEIEIAQKLQKEKIAALAGENNEERAKKTLEIEKETADKIFTIQSDLAKNVDKLNNEGADQQAQFEARKTEITAEGVSKRMEAEAKIVEQENKLYDTDLKNQEAAIQKKLQNELVLNKVRDSSGLAKITGAGVKDEQASYEAAATALQGLIADQQSHLQLLAQEKEAAAAEGNTALVDQLTDQEDATQNAIVRMQAQWDGYQAHVAQVGQAQVQAWTNNLQAMTGPFNSNLMSWMQGTEKFGRAVQKTWEGMASSAIGSILKIAEQYLIGHAMQKVAALLGIQTASAVAAANTVASTAAIPVVGPAAAPAAGATAFATTMAYAAFAEKGGIMQDDGALIAHKNEMILPPHLSKFVQDMASQRGGAENGSGGGDVHFNYSPTISAIDRNGVADALKDHADTIFDMLQQGVRNRNYG